MPSKMASQCNPQSTEVSKKIKRLSQLAHDKKRVKESENMRSNVDMAKHLGSLKSEMSEKYGAEDCSKEIFSFLIEAMESAVKSWHETSKVNPRVYFLLDKEKTDTDKYAPVVNIDKAFESPHTHSSCFVLLRQYAQDSFSRAACLVAPKSIFSYPQVWKHQGSRKWKHGQNGGFFIQFETPFLRRPWFISSSVEKGQMLCRIFPVRRRTRRLKGFQHHLKLIFPIQRRTRRLKGFQHHLNCMRCLTLASRESIRINNGTGQQVVCVGKVDGCIHPENENSRNVVSNWVLINASEGDRA
ncbi:hypothetical protein RJ641_004014, partial [Dillenia turbinata]